MSVRVTDSIIIKGKADDIFDMWADFEMFPVIMKDVKTIRKLDDQRSHWVVKGPLGKDVEWTAEITRFEEDRRIAWKTIDGDISTSGQITFKELPNDQTEMSVLMQYVPPAGKVGEVASKVLDDPKDKVNEGLREFKNYAESGSFKRQHKPFKDA